MKVEDVLQVQARVRSGYVHVQYRVRGANGYEKTDIKPTVALRNLIEKVTKSSTKGEPSFAGSGTRYVRLRFSGSNLVLPSGKTVAPIEKVFK